MPASEFRLWLDGAPADADRLGRCGEVRVDQAIGMATQAEVDIPLQLDDDGRWSSIDEDWAQAFRRVRVEVKVGDGEFVALVDGPIVSQRFELTAEPGTSRMVLIAQDDSVLLDREEKVALFEDMADSDIASRLISEPGLTPEVDSTPSAGSALQRVVVQRGSNMQLLRELARRHGMFAYVKPGPTAGTSIGVFKRPQLAAGELPEILLLGPTRNAGRFDATFDALRPLRATAGSVTLSDRTAQTSSATSATLAAMQGDAAHDIVDTPATTLLARTREESTDLDAATEAAVNISSWAWSATVDLDADTYPAVVRAYDVVRVAGAGGQLSGDWLVSRASHVIGDAAFRTRLGLRRNAQSTGAGAGGGIPGGIL
jgi:phage protein D